MSRVPRARVVSVVEDSWGRSTVYDQPEDPAPVKASQHDDAAGEEASQQDSGSREVSARLLVAPPEDRADYCLAQFQAALLATILEDTITQLRILETCNTEMRISKTMFDMDKLIAVKFSIRQPKVHDELDSIDPGELHCDEYKLRKVDNDREFFSKLMTAAYEDLCLNKAFKVLRQLLTEIVALEDERIFTGEDEARNRVKRRELARQLRQQRNHAKSQTYDANFVIDTLKTNVEDAALNADIRSRYVDNWQNARTEQHRRVADETEARPLDAIEAFKVKSDHEQRVHNEVELLINIEIDETLQKIEEWMEKYDKDMEAIDLRIQFVKNDYQNSLDRRVDLEQTLEAHEESMRAWRDFKERREQERQYRARMHRSAVAVQAWWRGLLVRRQLGPYRPPKKPKKPPKK